MNKRSFPLRFWASALGALALVVAPLFVPPALAQLRPSRGSDLTAIDNRSPASPKPERTAERERGRSHLAAQLPSAMVDFDPLLDSPKFIRSSGGFLTGPHGQGRGVSALTAQALPADDPVLPVKAFLNEHRALFGFGAEVLSEARVKRDYVDNHNGLRTDRLGTTTGRHSGVSVGADGPHYPPGRADEPVQRVCAGSGCQR